ncbi:hypothetical protein LTR17_004153 [Elasticomyces elasticus]|nr:hypothetical protein LTR17_004153 [Elasticomyces elasticus]
MGPIGLDLGNLELINSTIMASSLPRPGLAIVRGLVITLCYLAFAALVGITAIATVRAASWVLKGAQRQRGTMSALTPGEVVAAGSSVMACSFLLMFLSDPKEGYRDEEPTDFSRAKAVVLAAFMVDLFCLCLAVVGSTVVFACRRLGEAEGTNSSRELPYQEEKRC